MRKLWTGLLLALLAAPAAAHQDRIFTIASDGTLEGFPAEYGPASLHVTFATSNGRDEPPVTAVVLRVGAHETRLPACVTGLLLTQRMEDVSASGSWYHVESTLPYYINIGFDDPGQSGWARSGYTLLVDMRSAKVMRMDVRVVRDGGTSLQMLPIDLVEQCRYGGNLDFLAPRAPGA